MSLQVELDEERKVSPVLILTISNGAGHTRAAEAIALAIGGARAGAEALAKEIVAVV